MCADQEAKTYAHEPLDPKQWIFALDNRFATEAANQMMLAPNSRWQTQESVFCQRCRNIVEQALTRRNINSADVSLASSQCDLCRLLAHTLFTKHSEKTEGSNHDNTSVSRVGSKLVLEMGNGSKQALTIGQMPGAYIRMILVGSKELDVDNFEVHGGAELHDGIQVSLPHLVQTDTSAYAILLRQWLRDCDENHGDCWRPSDQKDIRLPTRLIEIGGSPAVVRLVESAKSFKNKPRFAALSYPWGDSRHHEHYFTDVENYEMHKRQIPVEALPPLLQNAIQVTRDIGIEYLWIDALCIKQGPNGDFNYEAERMEDVFSAAYCVLAASRATGVSDGFMGPRKQRQVVAVPNSSLFLSEDIDDFQHDVIEGHLNKRGWVLQERALARRTIYFTESQTYWECGRGVRCETFSKMSKYVQIGMKDNEELTSPCSKQAAFLGDSDFPRMAGRDTKGSQIRLFESLYEQYSRLHFTNDHDKPIAIAGLERRLCAAFHTDGGFGVFDIYLGRSLLWQRATADVESLTKITFPCGQEHVPSWSWMAYHGGIKFLDPPFAGIEWTSGEYRSPWKMVSVTKSRNALSVRDHSTSTLGVIARDFSSKPDGSDSAQSEMVWDGAIAMHCDFKCVVIGKLRAEADRPTQKHYVLILKQSDHGDTFERVGVGCLAKDRIDFSGTQRWSLVR